MSKKIKISIITVCYNAAKEIEKTVLSVKKQTYDDIEYLIKDGDSSDGTYELLCELNQGGKFRIIRGEDRGIYDAMNIAVRKVTGDYIFFLNAGDIFVNNCVVEKFVEFAKYHKDADVIFGNVIRLDKEGKKHYRTYPAICSKKIYFLSGDCICHQVIFAKRESLLKRPFLLDFRVCADREWMLALVQTKKCFAHIDLWISQCEEEGYSTCNQLIYEREVKKCIDKYFNKIEYMFYIVMCYIKQNRRMCNMLKKMEIIFFSKME